MWQIGEDLGGKMGRDWGGGGKMGKMGSVKWDRTVGIRKGDPDEMR